jgi:hypothetical protein
MWQADIKDKPACRVLQGSVHSCSLSLLEAGILYYILFYDSYVHTRLGSFLPPAPPPLPLTPPPPSPPTPPQYPAETILPLFQILLKREYKQ